MWARAGAGVLAGFFVAAAATGLVAWLPPGPWQNALVPSLIVYLLLQNSLVRGITSGAIKG